MAPGMSSPYTLGTTLTVRLEDQSKVNALIIQIPSEFTLSCVVVVQLSHRQLSGHFVLKLYDRVHASQLRMDEEQPWSPEVESAYQDFVARGLAEPFFAMCKSRFENNEFWSEDGWTTAEREAFLQYSCWQTYETEKEAYRLLRDMQGVSIPKLFTGVYISASAATTPNKYLDCPGLLLEQISGYPLSDLAINMPRECWQSICEETVDIVDQVSQRGVCNKDVKPRNFIVCPAKGAEGHRVVQLDFGLCSFRTQAKDDDEFRRWQADQDEEGAVGRVMERRLKGGFEYRRSSWSEQLLDEFKRE